MPFESRIYSVLWLSLEKRNAFPYLTKANFTLNDVQMVINFISRHMFPRYVSIKSYLDLIQVGFDPSGEVLISKFLYYFKYLYWKDGLGLLEKVCYGSRNLKLREYDFSLATNVLDPFSILKTWSFPTSLLLLENWTNENWFCICSLLCLRRNSTALTCRRASRFLWAYSFVRSQAAKVSRPSFQYLSGHCSKSEFGFLCP